MVYLHYPLNTNSCDPVTNMVKITDSYINRMLLTRRIISPEIIWKWELLTKNCVCVSVFVCKWVSVYVYVYICVFITDISTVNFFAIYIIF